MSETKAPKSKSKESTRRTWSPKSKWLLAGLVGILVVANGGVFLWSHYSETELDGEREEAAAAESNVTPEMPQDKLTDAELDALFSDLAESPPEETALPKDQKTERPTQTANIQAQDLADEILGKEIDKALDRNPEPTNEVKIAPAKKQTGFDKDKILSDFESRIDDKFAVPKGLRERVGFWFDIYTRYDDTKHIIHNSLHPWIVYKVVDVSRIVNAKTPTRRWQRNLKAEKFVAAEAAKIRAAIRSIAKKGTNRDLNSSEKVVVKALKSLGPNVRRNAILADGNTRVQLGQRNFFEEGLVISPRYLPEMERIFAAHKLPIELSRLPFVESSFKDHATSKVGASGIWQFMGDTGRKFMLVNNVIDERRSPFKATEAAARLLKENHLILYRNWALALTAYNHGPSGVRKAVSATGTKDLAKIIKTYRTKNFNFASSNFYCSFLAALHAQKYNDVIWGELRTEQPLNTHFIRLPKAYRPSQLLKLTGMTADEMLAHNPDLKKAVRGDHALPAGFRFHVPTSLRTKVERVLAEATIGDRKGKPSKG